MLDEYATAAIATGAAAVATGVIANIALNPTVNKADPWIAPKKSEVPSYSGNDPVWTSEPNGDLPIRYAQTGMASTRFGTMPQLMEKVANEMDDVKDTLALRVEKPGAPKESEGEWISWTWQEYRRDARRFARALMSAGFEPFEAVAICGFNGPFWFIAHMGAQYAVGLSAGTYTTNTPEACKYVADHSKSRVVVVDNIKTLDKYLEVDLETVKHIVVANETIPEEYAAKYNSGSSSKKSRASPKKSASKSRASTNTRAVSETNAGDAVNVKDNFLLSWDEFMSLGDLVADEELDQRMKLAKVEQACSLIYTSGTTGNPKAVMVSHDNVQFVTLTGIRSALGDNIDPVKSPLKEFHILSYLPLSHIAAQVLDTVFPLTTVARMNRPVTVSFARPDALKGSLPVSLKAVRPTLFFGVPRVWEKIAEGMKAKAKATPAKGLKLKLVNWAKRIGLECSQNRQVGGSGVVPRGYGVANKLIYTTVKKALGLERSVLFVTGGAPTTKETLNYFASVGIDITEVYGMSETTGNGTCGSARRFLFGSAGTPMIGQEMKLEHIPSRDKPGEGEICYRGRHVMMGYLRNPDKTAETIDPEGWLHSGDVGRFTLQQELLITGRIKELIIGAGGENIAPVPIEDEIKRLCPAISNAVMIGDQRKFNTVLLTLKSKPNLETGEFEDELAGDAVEVNPSVKTVTAARTCPVFKKVIDQALKTYNDGPTCVSHAQKIQKYTILKTDLSVPGGDLTATMKVKRAFVSNKYSEEIEAMYA